MLMLAFSFTACSGDDEDSSSKRFEREKDDEDEDDDKDKDKDDEEEKVDKKDEDNDDEADKPADEDASTNDDDTADVEKSDDEDTDDEDSDDKNKSSLGGAAVVSDNLMDCHFSIDGVNYQIPMWFSEYEALGWEYEGDKNLKLGYGDYDFDVFEKDGVEIWVDVINYSINATEVKDCVVSSIEFDGDDIDENTVIKFAKDIQFMVSTKEDIIAAYGEPDDIYEGSYRTYFYYYSEEDVDYYLDVTFSFDNETGLFDGAEFVNEVEVEGFDNTLNPETPAFLDDYVAPSSFGDTIYDTEISIDGYMYVLPCPVTEFYVNGYELSHYYEIDYIPAGQSFYCNLENGDKNLTVYLMNFSDYATDFDNCYVVSVSYDSSYDGEMAIEMAGGIKIGMTEDEFLKILGDIEYNIYESDDYNYYSLYESVWEYSNRRSYNFENGLLTNFEMACDKSPVE